MHTHQSPHAHTHVKKESISLHVLSTLQGLDMVIYLIILKNWNTDYWAVSCGSLANANTASGLFISKTWTVLFPKPSFSKLLTVPDFRMKSWGSVNWKKYVCKQLLIVGQSVGGGGRWTLIPHLQLWFCSPWGATQWTCGHAEDALVRGPRSPRLLSSTSPAAGARTSNQSVSS